MTEPGSVTFWLDRLKAGEGRDEAVAELWRRYFAELARRAERHLRGRAGVKDGEDVALSVFDAVARGAEAGKFPNLSNRNHLWQVLLRVTANKAVNAHRDATRARRDARRVLRLDPADESGGGLDVSWGEPDPGEAEELAEGAAGLLALLEDDVIE